MALYRRNDPKGNLRREKYGRGNGKKTIEEELKEFADFLLSSSRSKFTEDNVHRVAENYRAVVFLQKVAEGLHGTLKEGGINPPTFSLLKDIAGYVEAISNTAKEVAGKENRYVRANGGVLKYEQGNGAGYGVILFTMIDTNLFYVELFVKGEKTTLELRDYNDNPILINPEAHLAYRIPGENPSEVTEGKKNLDGDFEEAMALLSLHIQLARGMVYEKGQEGLSEEEKAILKRLAQALDEEKLKLLLRFLEELKLYRGL